MNPDLKDFIERQKATYSSLIEQAVKKRNDLLSQAGRYDAEIKKYDYLLKELEEDEEKWKSS